MSKSLEELQREYEKNTVKLDQEIRKLRRLENRKSYLDSGSRHAGSEDTDRAGILFPDGAHCRMAAGSEHGTACG